MPHGKSETVFFLIRYSTSLQNRGGSEQAAYNLYGAGGYYINIEAMASCKGLMLRGLE